MAAFTDVRAEAANTVMRPTSPTPIMRAAAVAEVRFGLRIAFSRASVPVMPLTFWMGMPNAPLIGPAMIGPRSATPRNTTPIPTPTASRPASAKRPSARKKSPMTITTMLMTARIGDEPE
jgi:hypothetical protein